MTKRAKRLLIGTAAVALLLGPPSSTPAKAEISDTAVLLKILAYLQAYVVPVIETILGMPDTLDGGTLETTQKPIGESDNSYLTTTGIGRFDRLFPDNPTLFTPDDATAYAIARNLDRKARVNEAMDEAAAIIMDQETATERLDGFALRNQEPLESLAGVMKLGNQIGIETAGSIKELTTLTAEAAQLEADQRAQEDWQRRQQDAWLRNHYGTTGYWTGLRSWQPETMKAGW
jgi:hypothetical protein